jgi:PPOX class probable F420-dependent enzyme
VTLPTLTVAVREFLNAPRFAVLATIGPDSGPRQTVMWYEVEGDLIMFNTKVGRAKERDLARDRRVALCVAEGYRFVALTGRVVREIRDRSITEADIVRLGVRYDGEAEAERQRRELWSAQHRVTYYMAIEHVHAVGLGGP